MIASSNQDEVDRSRRGTTDKFKTPVDGNRDIVRSMKNQGRGPIDRKELLKRILLCIGDQFASNRDIDPFILHLNLSLFIELPESGLTEVAQTIFIEGEGRGDQEIGGDPIGLPGGGPSSQLPSHRRTDQENMSVRSGGTSEDRGEIFQCAGEGERSRRSA